MVCRQRLERLENILNSFNYDFREPLAQLGFLFVCEFAHDAEFVDGNLVQPFGDDDWIIPEVETQRTDVIHLRERNGHFLVFFYREIECHILAFFFQTCDFIGFLISNAGQPTYLRREGMRPGIFLNAHEA